jgi:hypothetical protein
MKKIVYVFIFFIVVCLTYVFYNNTFELFITNVDETKSKGWNMDNIQNGNLDCSNGVCKLVCNAGYNESNGICCGNGKYNTNGICCDYGLVNDGNGKCVVPTNTFDNKYDQDISQSMDMQYHKTDQQLMTEAQPTDVQFGNTYVYNENGKKIPYPFSLVQGNVKYYTPGSYPFGTTNYVPKYEDSIFLSKLTGLSTTTPVYNTEKMMGGFCSYFDEQPQQKEKICNQLKTNECASTSCCILMGSAKCVSGNINGPTYKKHYGDIFLRNKDYYYYQGKCYGNCQ